MLSRLQYSSSSVFCAVGWELTLALRPASAGLMPARLSVCRATCCASEAVSSPCAAISTRGRAGTASPGACSEQAVRAMLPSALACPGLGSLAVLPESEVALRAACWKKPLIDGAAALETGPKLVASSRTCAAMTLLALGCAWCVPKDMNRCCFAHVTQSCESSHLAQNGGGRLCGCDASAHEVAVLQHWAGRTGCSNQEPRASSTSYMQKPRTSRNKLHQHRRISAANTGAHLRRRARSPAEQEQLPRSFSAAVQATGSYSSECGTDSCRPRLPRSVASASEPAHTCNRGDQIISQIPWPLVTNRMLLR